LVGGAWVDPAGAERRVVRSPATGQVIGDVPLSPSAAVAEVVAQARAAQPAWAHTPLRERTAVLFRLRELIQRDLDGLGARAAAESGKTVAEGKAGVQKGLEVLEFALAIQNLDVGGKMEVSRGITCEYRREPLGVVAGITPFNFPAMVPLWMFPIAIALGNAFILKPSEKVPITACRLAALGLEAGLPPGVLSLVHGGADTALAVVSHPDVAAIAFVGSTPVARRIYESGSALGKRVLALGGAKNHLIVVPDAEVEMTAQAVLDSFTGCAGQRCMAASVMVAVGDVQAIVERLVAKAQALPLGTHGGAMGALIDAAAASRLGQAIAAAQAAGAHLLVDGRGRLPADPALAGGTWLGPTILDHVAPGSEAASRELFGPVLSIVRVPTLSAALAVENASPYGNAASVFTTSGAVAHEVAERAKAGMIGVNVGVPVPREPFSFGGMGESKFGHGDITGPSSLELWSVVKKVTSKWSTRSDGSWMS
jgi:malonate-semialdehyde dehydrogenase (acetylating)/methylmalonate-semialdehyde dehydrogenase